MGPTIRVDTIHNLVTITRGGKIGNPRQTQLTYFLDAHLGTVRKAAVPSGSPIAHKGQVAVSDMVQTKMLANHG